MRCTENCSACCQYWSTERAQFFSVTVPDCTWHNQWFKSWMNWATKFCLICHIHPTSHQLTTTSSSILTTFLQGKCFHNHQDAENTFQVLLESRSTDFYATGNKFISSWQKYIDCNPIFLFSINKDVFEANYNDLKFRVWNHNYFCTNLIENKQTHRHREQTCGGSEGRKGWDQHILILTIIYIFIYIIWLYIYIYIYIKLQLHFPEKDCCFRGTLRVEY